MPQYRLQELNMNGQDLHFTRAILTIDRPSNALETRALDIYFSAYRTDNELTRMMFEDHGVDGFAVDERGQRYEFKNMLVHHIGGGYASVHINGMTTVDP